MPELELSAGTIDYQDTGGEGPVVVLLHGVAMDSSLWRHVVAGLRDDFRCVVPTLPLGGHRRPIHPDADLSILGVARLVDEFLGQLDLSDVTLVLNDWGGAHSLVADGRTARIGRLVITSCEAFDNYPPGLPGSNLVTSARLPGGLALAFNLLRLTRAATPGDLGLDDQAAAAARKHGRLVPACGRLRRDTSRPAQIRPQHPA
jgi:pimeloyl-ACP methyl ester carboxylesterase